MILWLLMALIFAWACLPMGYERQALEQIADQEDVSVGAVVLCLLIFGMIITCPLAYALHIVGVRAR